MKKQQANEQENTKELEYKFWKEFYELKEIFELNKKIIENNNRNNE